MRRALAVACLWGAAEAAAPQPQPKSGPLTEITDSAGLQFVHEVEDAGRPDYRYPLPDIMGPGAAFVDYDADGDLDIYLLQSAGKPNRLFRQEADGTLSDATEASGLGDLGFGMGVGAGDVDNDGRVDLYVTNYGEDALYLNQGEGRFADVTREAGLSGSAWSASAVFCDYDRDGLLDLYVTRYVDYDPTESCTQADGSRDYCAPAVFPGTADKLYRNLGAGSFEDVSERSGIASVRARGLGVVCADLDEDGWLDFYVANDGEANQLWQNQGNGKFLDDAFLSGVALNAMGRPEAGMGVTVGDVDGDGDIDLFMTHIADETNTLYTRDGSLGFEDRSTASGLAAPSLGLTGFGAAFFDIDHDGDLDLAIANGRVERLRVDVAPRVGAGGSGARHHWERYAEPNLLMLNEGSRFVPGDGGDFSTAPGADVSRALAVGDFDGDGDLDLLVTSTGGPARLYRNDAVAEGGADWLVVRAYDPVRRRDAHGASITAVTRTSRSRRIANPGYGYLSSHDPRAHFALPRGARVEHFDVVWPDGSRERFPGSLSNRKIVLEKGGGEGSP